LQASKKSKRQEGGGIVIRLEEDYPIAIVES